MKKMVYILLVTVCAGAAVAQTKPAAPASTEAPAAAEPERKANAIGMDMFQLFKGFIASDNSQDFFAFDVSAGYERLIAPNFSIGADIDLYYFSLGGGANGFYFSLAGEGRYYPMSENFEKLFIGTTLGINILSLDGSIKSEDGGFMGLITSLKMGYKVIIAKSFYLEPSLSYVLSKTSIMALLGGIPTPLGWNGGLRFGYTF